MRNKRRRARPAQVNVEPASREALEKAHGQVWDTKELAREFVVVRFSAHYVIVRRKADGVLGSLAFQNLPRLYFNFRAEGTGLAGAIS